jgi:hypothetical protein
VAALPAFSGATMTLLSYNRILKRETAVLFCGRPIVIHPQPHVFHTWLKGTRRVYQVHYEQISKQGVEIEVRRRREEKHARRKERKR